MKSNLIISATKEQENEYIKNLNELNYSFLCSKFLYMKIFVKVISNLLKLKII